MESSNEWLKKGGEVICSIGRRKKTKTEGEVLGLAKG